MPRCWASSWTMVDPDLVGEVLRIREVLLEGEPEQRDPVRATPPSRPPIRSGARPRTGVERVVRPQLVLVPLVGGRLVGDHDRDLVQGGRERHGIVASASSTSSSNGRWRLDLGGAVRAPRRRLAMAPVSYGSMETRPRPSSRPRTSPPSRGVRGLGRGVREAVAAEIHRDDRRAPRTRATGVQIHRSARQAVDEQDAVPSAAAGPPQARKWMRSPGVTSTTNPSGSP